MELPIHLKFLISYNTEHKELGEEIVAILKAAEECTRPVGEDTASEMKHDVLSRENNVVINRFEVAVSTIEEWYRIQNLQYFIGRVSRAFCDIAGLELTAVEVSQLDAVEDRAYKAACRLIFEGITQDIFPEASDTDFAIKITPEGDPNSILKFCEAQTIFEGVFEPIRKRYIDIPRKTAGAHRIKEYFKYVSSPSEPAGVCVFANALKNVLSGITLKCEPNFNATLL